MELEYQLFWGVDGRQGLPSAFEGQVDRELTVHAFGRDLTDGEYACALSHREIYRYISENNLGGAVILEDDAKLLPEFEAFIRNQDYLRAPMILLDHAYGRATRLGRIQSSAGKLRRVANQCTVSTAYSLNHHTAHSLLQATSPVRSVADWPASLYDLNAWMMVPRIARHNPPETGPSHLEAERLRSGPGGIKITSFRSWLREKLSVRVGRAKGQR